MSEMVLAIDPGRDKCGLAVVHRSQGLQHKTIIRTQELVSIVRQLVSTYHISDLVLGDGTTSGQAKSLVTGITTTEGLPVTITVIDEYRSTDQARARYWQDNPPKGIRRLFPIGMQVPPLPVDDYVALILAEKYFLKNIQKILHYMQE